MVGEHPNVMYVTIRDTSAQRMVHVFVKHNCVRHFCAKTGSETCFYHGAHHYTYSVSTRPLQMCVKLIAGAMGTKAECPRPFLTMT